MNDELFRDPSKTVDERVGDLLSKMTLEEKLGQMLQLDGTHGDLRQAILELHAGSLLHIQNARADEAIDLNETTRLRIPLLLADDCIHGHGFMRGATVFPTQLAMASTWDAKLLERAARVTALEASCTGLHWTFSPVLDVTRDLRWGRVGETFGEDLLLAADMGAAMIQGYQGEGLFDKTALLATAKHFAGYCETQGGRDASEADLSQRKLRSWFFPPFLRAVRAGCMTFMTGYQAIDGVPSTACDWLLKSVLRDEWGFEGVLVTDWDNVGRMHWEQQVCADMTEAATVAVTSGNDLMMATPQFFEAAKVAVKEGRLSEVQIDAVVARILALKFKMGLFEDPRRPDFQRQQELVGCAAHRAINLDVARKSVVLLQNNGILPLASSDVSSIAVVGPNADDPHAQLGDWAGASGQVAWLMDGQPRECVTTVLDGLRAYESESLKIHHEKGADIVSLNTETYGYFNTGAIEANATHIPTHDDAQLNRAIELSMQSDVTIAVVGDHFALAGENCSTATLELQGGQIELLERLSRTGKPLVVVLVNTKPMVLPRCIHDAAAILEVFNPGMEGGRAVAETLFGDNLPEGRLSVSIPYHVGQQPIYYHQIRGQHGDRYADMTQHPHFPFGCGLSYTRFKYSNLRLARRTLCERDMFECTVTLENIGLRPGVETVQLYIRDDVTSVTWAEKELKAYQKVHLLPGEKTDVALKTAVSNFTIVNARGQRVVEPGSFTAMVGPVNSTDAGMHASFEVVQNGETADS
ncbi:MAG: glycoside hydrolase family 3 C-terminal domain-containing protein [Deltaproteobacteria bacterium]|nr:glycoside hydrolase family 3 C-terminal domain-containing protein [Deltaproteobacteria bacterium]